MTTSLSFRVLPRYPARISATNGLTTEVENGADLVIVPDYGSLVPVPSVTNPTATFFMAWDSSIDYYQSISFQNFADNLAEQVLQGPLLEISELTMAADKGIYFSSSSDAATYDLSSFVRGISGSADAAAFRTAIGAWTSLGSNGQFLTVSGGAAVWADLGVSIHGATAKTSLVDADEFALSDSAASNVLKKVTLANLVTSLFTTARKIANAYFLSSFRLWDATDNTKGLGWVLSGITTATTRLITMADRDVNLNNVPTQWVSYTPTVTGFGTVSSAKFWSRRNGANLEIMGAFTSGTSTATTAAISLGFNGVSGGLTIDTFWNSARFTCGHGASSLAGPIDYAILGVGGAGEINIGASVSGRASLTPVTGVNLLAVGDSFSFLCSVPIQGWNV